MPSTLQPPDPPIGPFTRGLNTAIDARLLPADAAVEALNVELTDGRLRAIYGPGATMAIGPVSPSFGVVDAAYKWIFLPANNTWIAAQVRQHGCLDTTNVGYTTDTSAAGTARVPRIIYNAGLGHNSYPMGIVAPTALAVANGGGAAGGSRAYAVVFLTVDGLESNPYPVLGSATAVQVANCNGAALSAIPVSTDPRVTQRRIYATQANDPSGIKYRLAEIPDNVTTVYTDLAYAVVETTVLNWSPGGTINNDVLTFDHSPWPAVSVLSDQLHGGTPNAAAPGSGVLFAADATGYNALWAMVGFSQYLPTINTTPLPEPCQAIRSYGFQTLYFLPTSIWSFTGEADFSIIRGKTDAERGCKVGVGASVRRTPWGVAFASSEGVAMYANNQAPVITKGLLDPKAFNALLDADLTAVHAQYSNGFYMLHHATGTLVLDLRDFPQVRVTTSDKIVLGTMVSPYDFPSTNGPGYFVMLNGERSLIRRWSLVENVTGATRLAMSWKTPRMTAGAPDRLKLWTGLRVDGNGKAVFQFYRDDEATPRYTKTVDDLTKLRLIRLRGLRCRSLSVRVSSADGTGEITRMLPEGVMLDG